MPTIRFAFECNPWKISDSSMDNGLATVTTDGTLKLYTGASIERNKAFSGNYYYTFDVLDVVGNSSIVFGLKSYLKVVNNLSEGEYTAKWKSPSITFLDRVGDVITCCVGYRKGLMDKNHFDEIGRFDWNINEPLPVTVFVKDEIVVADGVSAYNAEDMITPMSCPGFKFYDQLLGTEITLDTLRNVVVYDIPANSKRIVCIRDIAGEAFEGKTILITKKGNNENSELIVVSTENGFFEHEDYYVLRDESTLMVYGGDGLITRVSDNFTSYRSSKKMKLQVNGLETEYVPASNDEIDYLMINLAEVNAEFSNVEIGSIKGGCL